MAEEAKTHTVLAQVQKNKETKYLTVKSGVSNEIGLWNCGFLHQYKDAYII
jgi:hypothetical protein